MNDIRMRRGVIFFLLLLTSYLFAYEDVEVDGILYRLDGDSAEITKYSGNRGGDIVIPSSVEYKNKKYKVTGIDNYAFAWRDNLMSITIPNTVTTIDSGAFSRCNGLANVIIPNSVTTISSGAFSHCDKLTSVAIPNSVTTIEKSAFSFCKGLTSVTIPNSVTTIGDLAFYYCESLNDVTIPNSVTTIGSYAFTSCGSLMSITIPNSVTTIGNYAFSGCNGLTSVTIPNSVTTIEKSAFYDCVNLTNVILSNGSINVHRDAFENCKSLKHISAPKDFDIKKLNLPIGIVVTNTPIVFSELFIDSIKYEGKTKDGDIRCNENGNLYVFVRNSAYGKAKSAVAKIYVAGSTKGIAIPKEYELGDLPQKQSMWVKIPIATTDQIIDGEIYVKVVVIDDKGVKSNKKEIEIKTHKSPLPDLKIVSHKLLMDYDTVLTKDKTFELKVTLKNEGEGVASKHFLNVVVPEGLKIIDESSGFVPEVLPQNDVIYSILLYSSSNAKDNLDVKFEIENSAKEQVNNYDVRLEFGKTKAEPKNVIQRSVQKGLAVDSMVITENITLQQYTTLKLTRNEWSKYNSNSAILRIRITGAKPGVVREAKKLLNVYLGLQLAAKSVYKGEPNEVWFLIPVDASKILLTCGDGCKEIEVWNGDLENNKVYSGEIRVY